MPIMVDYKISVLSQMADSISIILQSDCTLSDPAIGAN
jgi:hypothetical protein